MKRIKMLNMEEIEKMNNNEKQREFMKDLRIAGVESGMDGKNAVEVVFRAKSEDGVWNEHKIYTIKVVEIRDG